MLVNRKLDISYAEFEKGYIEGFSKFISSQGEVFRGFEIEGEYIGIINSKRKADSPCKYELVEDGIAIKTFSEYEITLIQEGKLDVT